MSESNYQLKVNEIIEKIKEIDAHTVALQFPEGLKIHATSVARQIEDQTSANVIIYGDPCFGACDIPDVNLKGTIDLLVHFGHTPLPLDYQIPVLFVEAQFQIDVIPAVKEALNLLSDYKNIALVTNTQHLHLLDEITQFLQENGKTVLLKEGNGTEKGQVLGCNFSAAENLSADAFLYVGSGNFHPLGIKLSTHKPVIIADPYRNEARNIDQFADRILRIRFARITRAREAKKWGIIVSSKKGQNRMELAKSLKNMILKNMINEEGKEGVESGKEGNRREAHIILMDNVSPELLMPFMDLDAFVVTACPRIAIDDAQMYKKPLLTPEELLIVLDRKKWEDYQIDQIKYDQANQ